MNHRANRLRRIPMQICQRCFHAFKIHTLRSFSRHFITGWKDEAKKVSPGYSVLAGQKKVKAILFCADINDKHGCVMSSISSVGSAAASYGVQLAQSSKLVRSFSSLDSAIQTGNLTAAAGIIAAIAKDNPQYAASTTSGSTSSDPINQGFQTLSSAITQGDTEATRTAWTQLKSDLADAGVTISSGASAMQKIIAQAKDSIDQAIISSLSLGLSENGNSASSLLGNASADSSATSDTLGTLVSQWVTYKTTGATSQISTNSSNSSTSEAASSSAPNSNSASDGSLNVKA
jgi:hypothetical protein